MGSTRTNDGRILGIFAKQPIAGCAKTRLAAATSADWSLRVAQALLEDSLDRFGNVVANRVILYAPASAGGFFAQLAKDRHDSIAQADGHLGQRLAAFFAHARQLGFSRIVAIGCDSPTVPLEFIEQAFHALADHDAVIGPAFDGGYYLIGSGAKELPIFKGIPWSTSGVLEATVDRLRVASARTALLPPWYDVDTADNWAMLCGHVLAMRRAGIDPGVPHVEQLMQEPVS